MRAPALVALALCLGCAKPEASRLGGPEASEPVASLGTWVPVQSAQKVLLGQYLLPPVTLSGAQTITGAKTFSDTITSTVASGSNGLVLQTGAFLCLNGATCTKALRYDSVQNKMSGLINFDNGLGASDTITSTKGSGGNAYVAAQGALWCLDASCTKNFSNDTSFFVINEGISASGNIQTTGAVKAQTNLLVPVVHGSGTAQQAIESGSGAMTGGALAVTFGTAFSVAPKCTCTHVNTTNANACNISSAGVPSTTAVTFAVTSGGTDVVHWICIGAN